MLLKGMFIRNLINISYENKVVSIIDIRYILGVTFNWSLIIILALKIFWYHVVYAILATENDRIRIKLTIKTYYTRREYHDS